MAILLVTMMMITSSVEAHGWRHHCRGYRPYYAPPAIYCPPPPVFRERWIPTHWRRGPYGDERIPGHWVRERVG